MKGVPGMQRFTRDIHSCRSVVPRANLTLPTSSEHRLWPVSPPATKPVCLLLFSVVCLVAIGYLPCLFLCSIVFFLALTFTTVSPGSRRLPCPVHNKSPHASRRADAASGVPLAGLAASHESLQTLSLPGEKGVTADGVVRVLHINLLCSVRGVLHCSEVPAPGYSSLFWGVVADAGAQKNPISAGEAYSLLYALLSAVGMTLLVAGSRVSHLRIYLISLSLNL